MESLGDLTTMRQGESIIKDAPDFQKQADEVTKLLRGGNNNG